MNILIIGSGGREHAIAKQMVESERSTNVFVAPGNAGTAQIAKNLKIDIDDFKIIKKEVLQNNIEMMIIGPEKPLVDGLYDFFKEDEDLKHVKVIGPSKEGAILEGSKKRAKEFMLTHEIPTAAYRAFSRDKLEEGKRFLENLNPPYVLKADGLAAGKGVLILDDVKQAKKELENMLTQDKFGSAGNTVVIEEFLDGIELSVFALTDGKDYILLPTAKDYKRIGEGDTGLNTGGMGAVSPVPFADDEFMEKIETQIVKPTIEGLHKENIDFKGFVFFGLINVEGEPYVIEYNVRMGDPESEVVLPRIKTDLLDVFDKLSEGRISEVELQIDSRAAVTIMLVSGGYPEDYKKGKEIHGLEDAVSPDTIVYHAGTTLDQEKVLTNGGRVIALTGFGNSYKEAMSVAYGQVDKISFDKMYFRKDIGKDLERID